MYRLHLITEMQYEQGIIYDQKICLLIFLIRIEIQKRKSRRVLLSSMFGYCLLK